MPGLRLQGLNWVLVGLVTLLGLIGLLNLYSTALATQREVHLLQGVWLILGFGAMYVVARAQPETLRRWAPILYVVVVALLALVLMVGVEVNGSKRWLDFGIARFQPSEFAKLAVIMVLAIWFDQTRAQTLSWREFLVISGILGIPMALVFHEPDLGHAMMLLFIGGSMVLYQRFDRRAIAIICLLGFAAVPVIWEWGLRDYQKVRVLTLLEGQDDALGAGWHSRQARLAVGSGGAFGKGHGEGTQVAGGFLPENHTDFVFAHFAEEHGFVGAGAVLLLYLMLILLVLAHGSRARDTYGGMVAVGVAALIFWHVALNVGMVLQVLPVTGVTLPLMSYGGSSAVTVFVAMGLLLNTNVQRRAVGLGLRKLAA